MYIRKSYIQENIMSRYLSNYKSFVHSTLNIPSLSEAPLSYVLRNCNFDDGIAVELGVYSGTTIKQIVSKFNGEVHGFDSFEGLPERWDRNDMTFDKGHFDVKGNIPIVEGATLHKGWFSDTLPPFVASLSKKISLLHVDCDLYSSTIDSFRILGPHLSRNCVIVFDELLDYPNYEQGELKALYEYAFANNTKFDWIGKYGNVRMEPERDRGPVYQAVTLRLL